MHKRFKLQSFRCLPADLSNLFKGQLSGKHDAFHAHAMPEFRGLIIRHIRLRAEMDLCLRYDLLYHGDHAGIADNERVQIQILDFVQIIAQRLDILVVRVDIHRQIAFDAMRVTESDALGHFCETHIAGSRAQGKQLTAEVNGIRAVKRRDF